MFRMPNTSSLTRTLAASAVLAIGLTLSGGAFAQNAVVAKVGELEITEQELLLAQSELAQEFAKVPEDKRRAAILAALIDIKLLANKAQAAGYQEDEKFKSQMAFVRARTLHNIYFQKNVVEAISDEEIKQRFEKEIAGVAPEKEVKARHILVESEEEAKAIIADLVAGKDFVELAKEKSTGPSGPNGGDLGFFGKGQMVPAFEETVFGLEDGKFTMEPVKTQFGYHVILREEERDKPLPELAAVSDQIKQLILREKYFNTVKEIRSEISVDILDAELKAAVEATQQ